MHVSSSCFDVWIPEDREARFPEPLKKERPTHYSSAVYPSLTLKFLSMRLQYHNDISIINPPYQCWAAARRRRVVERHVLAGSGVSVTLPGRMVA